MSIRNKKGIGILPKPASLGIRRLKMRRLSTLVLLLALSSAPAIAADQGTVQLSPEIKAEIRSSYEERISEHRTLQPKLAAIEEKMMNAQLEGKFAMVDVLNVEYMNEMAQAYPQVANAFKASAESCKRTVAVQREIDSARQAGKLELANQKENLLESLLGMMQAKLLTFGK